MKLNMIRIGIIPVLICYVTANLASSEEVMNINKNVGENVTFDFPVWGKGFLSITIGNLPKMIAHVIDQEFNITDHIVQFGHRIYWDSKTGYFSIIKLQKNDSNYFHIECKEKNSKFSYNLQVHDLPPVIQLNISHVTADSCSLQCLSDNIDNIQWYKDNKIVNESSNVQSLSIIIPKEDQNSSFTCTASNSEGKTTRPVNVTDSCKFISKENNLTKVWIAVGVTVIGAILVAVGIIMWRRGSCNKVSPRGSERDEGGSICIEMESLNPPPPDVTATEEGHPPYLCIP